MWMTGGMLLELTTSLCPEQKCLELIILVGQGGRVSLPCDRVGGQKFVGDRSK